MTLGLCKPAKLCSELRLPATGESWRDGLVGRVLARKHEGMSSDPHKGQDIVRVAIHGPGWLGYSFCEKGRSQDTDKDHVAPKQPHYEGLPVHP